jgi:hypothetical protein
MSKRTRLFLVGSIGILVLGLGSGAVASYMGLQNFVVIGGDGPSELAYVPRDARMVAFADLHDIVNSELRQKLREVQGTTVQQPRRFEEATGVDLERDVDRLLAFSTGESSAPAPNAAPPTILASGRFDTVRIEGFVRERGGVVEDYKGKRLITDTAGKMTVAFVEPGMVAVGAPAAVKAAIDTKRGAPTVRGNPDLMRLLKSVDDGNAWAVSRFDGIPTGAPIPQAIAGQLPAISWLAVSGHVDGGVRGTLRAEARDDVAAKDLRDVLRGFLALARLQGGQHAEFADIINSLEMGGDGKTVTLDFAVPSTAIAAISALPKRRPGGLSESPTAPVPAQPRVPAPVPGI